MRRILFAIILCFVFLPNVVGAVEIQSDAQLGEWFMNYYLHPTPKKAIDALIYYGNSSLYYKETSRPQFAYFIAMIFKDNPDLIPQAFEAIGKEPNENCKYTLVNVLWYMDTDQGREYMEKAQKEWNSKNMEKVMQWLKNAMPPQVLYLSITSPTELDLLWSHFFATGTEAPVKKIISALKGFDEPGAGKVIASAAQWSLMGNAKVHPRVLKICEEELKKTSGIVQKKLGEVVEKIKKL